MTLHRRFPLVMLFLLAITFHANSQDFLKTHGQAIVNSSGDTVLLKGMGLGGWMLQEGYMLQTAGFANAQYQIKGKIVQLLGVSDTEAFYDAWLANHVRKPDIDSLKAWGFNAIRLPMHYNLFTHSIQNEPVAGQNTWLNKGFELTDSLISWCKQNEMYVILHLHAAPGGQGYDQGISDYNPDYPSLWESPANREKTVALWKRLAERYANEPWVAGYDLINEPNWNLPGGTLLKQLYKTITDSIRTVDTNHILFIEGNWFANDFTGLTPPWDDNMVYSPHKYWSTNDQASIQWVLDIRDTYNVPLFLGESGENSNTWFRDAIHLLKANNIGWAWWPMKKIESIAGPLSIEKTPGYQALLDYWTGTGPAPSAAVAKATLMDLTNKLKIENCRFQKDVIDALFRQVESDATVPYRTQSIPGVVYSTDFDMGVAGAAYFDIDLANYQVSTGNYTAWNQGWAYRNDGIDIETTMDNVNSNGFNVGWCASGEWMQYDVAVATNAVYNVQVRVAANGSDGRFHFAAGDADISPIVVVPNTGGWQNWQTVTVPNVIVGPSDKKLRFYVDKAGFNLGSFNFIYEGPTNTLATNYLSAITNDEHTVQLNLNKPLAGPIPASPANFQLTVNGNAITITNTVLNTANPRIITFTVSHTFKSSDIIKISYTGTLINAQDGTVLNTFTQKDVLNTIALVHPVPGKVQAEGFFFQSGISLENTADVGGGQNIGYLDAGDYLDYYINVAQSGIYNVAYRTAALSETGQVKMQLIDANGNATTLHTVSFPSTGGWQTWTTTSTTASLYAGQHHIRVTITEPLFNMNWFDFTNLTATEEPALLEGLSVYPNPGYSLFTLQATLTEKQNMEMQVVNMLGQTIISKSLKGISRLQETLDLSAFPAGQYFVILRAGNGALFAEKLLKLGRL